MTARRVVVVRSAYGGIVAELAEWLGAELRAAGADASTAPAGAPSVADADLLVLLGAGPEFDAVLRLGRPGRRVVLWAVDPLPPPGLPDAVVRAGLRRGRRVAAVRRLERAAPVVGDPGSRTVARLAARRMGLGLLGARGGRSPIEGVHAADALFTFDRLAWIARGVERGAFADVLVSSPASVRCLAERGIPARYQPIAPHPAMGRDLGTRRDLPVVFLGSTLDGRGPRLAEVGRALDERGVRLTVVDRDCFGDARTALLNRAQVVLNLHKFPWHLERIRLLLATANGALFASELPVPDPEPFEAGRDLLAVATEHLADAIVDHLDVPEREAKVASAAAVLSSSPDLASVARDLLEVA